MENRIWYYGVVLALSSAGTTISYSTLKDSRIGLMVACLLGLVGSATWIFLARSIRCPNSLLMMGFYGDLVGKAAGVLIPIAVFGVKCDPRTLLGIGLMITGALIWK